jgi:RecA-family ATPase
MMVGNGIDHAGIRVKQCPVLYLDFETTKATFEKRMTMIRRGLGIGTDEYDNVYYRQMARPFVNDLVELTSIIKTYNIGLIVVDSMGMVSVAKGRGTRQENHDGSAIPREVQRWSQACGSRL